MPKIFVKWGTKKFEVDVSTELEPLVLKSQLFELTGVLPKKQRVLIKVFFNLFYLVFYFILGKTTSRR